MAKQKHHAVIQNTPCEPLKPALWVTMATTAQPMANWQRRAAPRGEQRALLLRYGPPAESMPGWVLEQEWRSKNSTVRFSGAFRTREILDIQSIHNELWCLNSFSVTQRSSPVWSPSHSTALTMLNKERQKKRSLDTFKASTLAPCAATSFLTWSSLSLCSLFMRFHCPSDEVTTLLCCWKAPLPQTSELLQWQTNVCRLNNIEAFSVLDEHSSGYPGALVF